MPTFDKTQLRTPFTLSLDGDAFVSLGVLRHIPGQRIVCSGLWRGLEVVAKIYLDRLRRRIHAKRETAGVRAMLDSGINTPALLYQTEYEDMQVLLFERIAPTETGLEHWARATSTRQLLILGELVNTVAALHNANLVQKDPHLGNFLFARQRIYALDGTSIQHFSHPIAVSTALDNLGLLFAQFNPTKDMHVPKLYADYARERKWVYEDRDLQKLRCAITRQRARRKRSYLRKIFRTSSRYQTHKDHHRFWICDRIHDSPAMRSVLSDPDIAMADARILKPGRTSTVGVIKVDGQEFLMKRYNSTSFMHECIRALRNTRARISWRNAHRLLLYGLATPKPVALVEKRWGPINRACYFICEYADAEDCDSFFHRHAAASETRDAVIKQICALFDALNILRIAHGDAKATNFLVRGAEVLLIDLDTMREYRNAWRAARAHDSDVQSFLDNWSDLPNLRALFERCLKITKTSSG